MMIFDEFFCERIGKGCYEKYKCKEKGKGCCLFSIFLICFIVVDFIV